MTEALRVLFVVSFVAMIGGWIQMFWGFRQWAGAVWLTLGLLGALIISIGYNEALR